MVWGFRGLVMGAGLFVRLASSLGTCWVRPRSGGWGITGTRKGRGMDGKDTGVAVWSGRAGSKQPQGMSSLGNKGVMHSPGTMEAF